MAFPESLYPTPPQVASPPEKRQRVPWGVGDMAKAIGLIIVGVLLIAVPAAAVAAAVAGDVGIDDDPDALSIILAASIGMELFILLSALLFSLRKYRASWADLGLRWPERGGWWLPAALALTGLIMVLVFTLAVDAAGADAESNIPDAAFDSVAPVLLLALLSLAFAPVIEELFFRGFIFGGLRGRWGVPWAAAASGFLFGVAHLGSPGDALVTVPIALVGFLFALGYAYSGSLLATIGAHFLFNLVSFIAGLTT